MRWRSKLTKIGDRRVVRRFAWLPVRISDENMAWLERYLTVQEYEEFIGGPFWRDVANYPSTSEAHMEQVEELFVETNKGC